MFNYVIVFGAFLLSLNSFFSQDFTFDKHKERAIFQERVSNIKILNTTFSTQQTISEELKDLQVELLENINQVISISYLDSKKVKVTYQETIELDSILKRLNRLGYQFSVKPEQEDSNSNQEKE